MSNDIYARILWWNGTKGIAKDFDMTVTLRHPPRALPNVAEIDYGEVEAGVQASPGQIREHDYDKKRDMEASEIKRVVLFLDFLGKAENDALEDYVT